MKRLAFVDQSYHKRTLSTVFFIDLLRCLYDVSEYYDESWCDGPPVDYAAIGANNYDAIVFFQILPWNRKSASQLCCNNITLVPMFDDVYKNRDYQWGPLLGHKFIAFSKALHRTIELAGGVSRHLQYYPDPSKFETSTNLTTGLFGFFWQRREEISWTHVRQLIGSTKFDSFHMHLASDPGFRVLAPDDADRKRHNISISEWFEDPSVYQDICRRANVYFAPRVSEGIGMSFLEAMARGNCVVAADSPTMNEYITHGHNGLLFDPANPMPIDFRDAAGIGVRARATAEAGYRAWAESQEDLLAFIATPIEHMRGSIRMRVRRGVIGVRYFLHRAAKKMSRLWHEVLPHGVREP